VRAYFRGFLALKSLVVGVAILALWGRSYFVGDHVRRGTDRQWIELGSAFGSTIITFGHDGKRTTLRGSSWQYLASRDPRRMLRDVRMDQDSVLHRLGFGFRSDSFSEPVRGMIYHIVIPHWLVFLLAMPSAVKWVWRRSRPPREAGSAAGGAGGVDAYRGPWECPTCGQMFAKPPPTCPICRTQLGVEEFV
jgi:hypothetical protein